MLVQVKLLVLVVIVNISNAHQSLLNTIQSRDGSILKQVLHGFVDIPEPFAQHKGILRKLISGLQNERIEREKRSVDTLLSNSNGHGGDLVDQDSIPADSDLTNLIESFRDETIDGNVIQPNNIHPEDKSKTIGEKKDRHRHKVSQDGSDNGKRNFVNLPREYASLWPYNTIPYVIRTSEFSASDIDVIMKGIEEFHSKTCLRIEPFSLELASRLGHSDYIEIRNGDGCSSYVGRIYRGMQELNLETPQCMSVSTVVHELCHAIGQEHEQSRGDRDEYVDIIWSLIEKGEDDENMQKIDTHNYNPYDYASVLQYGLQAMTKYEAGKKNSMEFKDRRLNFLADTAKGLEFYDVKDITDGYQCAAECQNPPKCENGGFVNFQCLCVCPVSLIGEKCEQILGDCGEIIELGQDETKTITSPNYPQDYPLGKKCTWLIKAPSGYHPKITIKELELSDNEGNCYHWLEIQYNLMGQTGPRVCGAAQNEVWESSKDADGMMMLQFDSTFASDRKAENGFSLIAEIVKDAATTGSSVTESLMNTTTTTDNDITLATTTEGPSGSTFGLWDLWSLFFSADSTTEDNAVTGYTTESPTSTTNFWDSWMNGVTSENTISESTIVTCSFEDGETCWLEESSNDIFDWTLGEGPLAFSGTKYKYIKSCNCGDYAILESNNVNSAGFYCFEFSYNMYGDVGELFVLNSDMSTPLFYRSGDQGNKWHTAWMDIFILTNAPIQIKFTCSQSWQGDNIAVDNITLKSGFCDWMTKV